MAHVPTPLNIPTFILLRHRIRFDPTYHNSLTEHIRKHRSVFTRKCSEKAKKSQSESDTGYRYIRCIKPKFKQVNRDLSENRPWSLPPNLFNVLKKPYEIRKGAGGAHWKKLIIKHNQTVSSQNVVTQYAKKTAVPILDSCNKHKGVFYSNARDRRPTSRVMVSNVTSCWRDPNEPGPLDYSPDVSESKPMKWKSKPEAKPNPYRFLPDTTVPEKSNYNNIRNTFQPGPGRYMTFIKRGCYMCRNKIIEPFITQQIDREKRLKFRRLPYKRMNAKKYCDSQYSHIKGHGFRHVFKLHESKNRTAFIAKEGTKKKKSKEEKEYVQYANAGYIRMISHPNRSSLLFKKSLEDMPVRIFYNCLAKRVKRKHLRSNKKIAFMSGQTRWKDAERPPIMTVSNLEEIKSRLPEDRRLTDYPTMSLPIEEIKSRLDETPPHMRPAYNLGLRKINFKFQPIPEPKVLVLEEEVRPHHVSGKYAGQRFFFKPLEAQEFFKEDNESLDSFKSHNIHTSEQISIITNFFN